MKKQSQIETNPYPYSSDNKRYQTISWYYRNLYGRKCAKIPLNAGFSCPNRDGSKAVGGCTFCSAKGSGDSILAYDQNLMEQYRLNLKRARNKWPDCLGIAYFQSFTNTYAPLETLQKLYTPFLEDPSVLEVAIATRADCLGQEVIDWLGSWTPKKPVWIELGLQTSNEKTAVRINRQHLASEVEKAVEACKKAGLKTCVHIMNSLPGETHEDMMETARFVARIHPDAIKIHMLHLIQGTKMAREYLEDPFPLLSLEEYTDLVIEQLEILPDDMIIERISGDGLASDLIEPQWTRKKTLAANRIDQKMAARNTWQGRLAHSKP